MKDKLPVYKSENPGVAHKDAFAAVRPPRSPVFPPSLVPFPRFFFTRQRSRRDDIPGIRVVLTRREFFFENMTYTNLSSIAFACFNRSQSCGN